MPPTSLYDQFAQAAAKQGRALSNRYGRRLMRREWTRQIVKTTQWDDFDWQAVRKTKEINDAITDLFMGDLKNPEDRPGYLNAPELVRDIFMTFLKPVPMLHGKKEVIRDARLNGKFIEQLMALTDWERLHDQTATDVMLSQMATSIVMDALKEMIAAHREQVKQANEERQNGQDPFQGKMPPTNGGDSWDEESGRGQGRSSSQAGGEGNAQGGPPDNAQNGPQASGHTDGTGESQTHRDQEDEEGEQPEPTPPPWGSEDEMRDSIRKELQEQLDNPDGAGQGEFSQQDQEEADGGAEGDGGGAEGDEEADGGDDHLDEEDREFDPDDLDAEWEGESDWEQMLEGVDFGRSVRGALEQAAQQIGDMEDSRRGVGLSDAEWKSMDPKERLKIAEKLNTPRMRAIADMVGRMKRFALSKQATKVIDAPHEIFDVEMGNDLRRVLRSEFAFLGHPATKPLFYRKFLDSELLQYKERGHEDVGKGPMIVCIDNSGSMSGAPENWAKGVAEAMRRVCADQGRDFHAIYFETNYHRERFDFPGGHGPFEKVLAFLSVSAGGGTEFDGVLTEALGKCKNMFEAEGKGKADIVFITDGEAYLNDDWIKQFVAERDEIGARIFGIYISAYDSTRSSACRLLERFCNTVTPVKALEVNDDATDFLFAAL